MSAVVVRITSTRLNATEVTAPCPVAQDLPPPAGVSMALLHEFTRNVTEVVLKEVRVQLAGAAVAEENTVPVPGRRKRIS